MWWSGLLHRPCLPYRPQTVCVCARVRECYLSNRAQTQTRCLLSDPRAVWEFLSLHTPRPGVGVGRTMPQNPGSGKPSAHRP